MNSTPTHPAGSQEPETPLKPCPFCGAPGELREYKRLERVYCSNSRCLVAPLTQWTPIDVIDEERAAVAWNTRTSTAEIDRLRAALGEIEKGEGKYNRDPLIHAENVIENLTSIARAALQPASAPEAV